MTGQTVALVPTESDAEVAKELKAEILAKLGDVCAVLDKATEAGFHVSFNIGQRWDGKQMVAGLTIAKHF